MNLRLALLPFGFIVAVAMAFLAAERISASGDRHFGYSVSAALLAP